MQNIKEKDKEEEFLNLYSKLNQILNNKTDFILDNLCLYLNNLNAKLKKLTIKTPFKFDKTLGKFVNTINIKVLNDLADKLASVLIDGSLNLNVAQNEAMTESVIQNLTLMVPFCHVNYIEIIILSCLYSLNYFPFECKITFVNILSNYFIPLFSISKTNNVFIFFL